VSLNILRISVCIRFKNSPSSGLSRHMTKNAIFDIKTWFHLALASLDSDIVLYMVSL